MELRRLHAIHQFGQHLMGSLSLLGDGGQIPLSHRIRLGSQQHLGPGRYVPERIVDLVRETIGKVVKFLAAPCDAVESQLVDLRYME
jgi:hypothetical protein